MHSDTVTSSGPEPATLPSGRRLTPMLQQYMDAKSAYPDAILMFRMGDFFELFFDDAKIAARELDLTLTARDKSEDPIPMAGVPHHAVAGYIAKLVSRGYTVAMCDQVEDPKLAKGLVKREITRLITPGTVSDLDAMDPASNHYVACVVPDGEREGERDCDAVALLDMLAGEILCTHCPRDLLGDELRRMGVRELLIPTAQYDDVVRVLGSQCQIATRKLESVVAPDGLRVQTSDNARHNVTNNNALHQFFSERFGCDLIEGMADGGSAAAREAVVHVVRFAEATQRRILRHFMPPRSYRVDEYVILDESTRRNLELCSTARDDRRFGSLLWHIDRCRTSLGSRRLRHWLLFPLRDVDAIARRLDMVQSLKEQRQRRETIQQALDTVRDIERLLGRVAVGRATPRDVGALGASLVLLPAIKKMFESDASSFLGDRWRALDDAADLCTLLTDALVDDLPVTATEGGIFKKGYVADLDELITLSTEGHDFLADLERRERERTGIANLKVRYNKVFGYYLEITKANLAQVPPDYVRKQTLVNAERFISDELKVFEEKVLYADERRRGREAELFAALLETIATHMTRLRAIARLIADTDALASLAEVADHQRYVRPEVVRESILALEQARHPVVERLMPGGERFVPNDVLLNDKDRQLMIVTGPNMAGKSTVMRQTALIALLAHMGSFVPASRARIGLCDRIFTRVGASDDLGSGHSTFMVEMLETAAILKHATAHSLVILDEIGRGTSTYDGVSIAWAVAEHLHDHITCRAMFATHYHELTTLAVHRDRIVNTHVAVKEVIDERTGQGTIVFLRRLAEGPANRSYGIHVAQMASLPESVLMRARQIMGELEQQERMMPHAGPRSVIRSEGHDKSKSASNPPMREHTRIPEVSPTDDASRSRRVRSTAAVASSQGTTWGLSKRQLDLFGAS